MVAFSWGLGAMVPSWSPHWYTMQVDPCSCLLPRFLGCLLLC